MALVSTPRSDVALVGKTLADATICFHTLGEIDLEDRAMAAAAAGFTRVGLSIRRTLAWLEDHPLGELLDLLGRHGLVVGELEALAPMGLERDAHEDLALALARDLGCGWIQIVGPLGGTVVDAARRLADLGDRAADGGQVLTLEFLPWTNIPDVGTAIDIVSRAARPNVGICVDIWHLYRSGGKPSDLDIVWPHLKSIQLDDGPLIADQPEDLREDCLRHRMLPGSGEFDLIPILAAAQRNSPDYRLSVEVISDHMRSLPVLDRASLVATATAATLAAVQESLSV